MRSVTLNFANWLEAIFSQSFWHIFWHSFWHIFWQFSDISLDILSDIFSDISFDILSDISSDILSDILSDITFDILSNISSDTLSDISSDISFDILSDISSDMLSDITFDILCDISSDIFWLSFWHSSWHSFWHIFWHSVWHIFWYFLTFFLTYLLTFCLTYFLTYLLTFFLTYLLTFFLTYLLTWLRLRSGAEHWPPTIAVEVRRGTLNSHHRGWGPARNTELTESRHTEHWTHRIADGNEDDEEKKEEKEEKKEEEKTDIKSNDPHLTGGESTEKKTGQQLHNCGRLNWTILLSQGTMYCLRIRQQQAQIGGIKMKKTRHGHCTLEQAPRQLQQELYGIEASKAQFDPEDVVGSAASITTISLFMLPGIIIRGYGVCAPGQNWTQPAPFLDKYVVPARPGCFISWSDLGRYCMHTSRKSPPPMMHVLASYVGQEMGM